MAYPAPPRNAIQKRVAPPKTRSSVDGPFSPAFERALKELDEVRDAGLCYAPIMPSPEAVAAASKSAGISPSAVLEAYLAILNYDNNLVD